MSDSEYTGGSAEAAAYSAEPRGLLAANSFAPLVNGDAAYPAMLKAIDDAKSFVHFETYIYDDDDIGKTFARRFAAAARRGVEVRLIVDALGSISLAAGFFGDLEDAGVQTLEYKPLRPWLGKWTKRDHRKIMVVDNELAFTGGLNVGLPYAPTDLGGSGWRDTHMSARGPVVQQLEDLFRGVWVAEGGAQYERKQVTENSAPGSQFGQAIAAHYRRRRTAIRRHYLHAIRHARKRIFIANAYFVPDPGIRRALKRAAKAGVDVRVITSENGDLRSVTYASAACYAPLMRAGVKIHLWPETTMHAKTAVVDDDWSVIGSYNLDYISLFNNLEVVVEVVDRGFAKAMQVIYQRDLERCRKLTLQGWKSRPWWRKLLEWLFYKIRRWM